MIRGSSEGAPGVDAEVAATVARLVETGERLQALAQGGSVALAGFGDRDRFLQDAQALLGDVDLAKSAAILDSLPATIALLDSQGTIVAVNQAWRSFALANLMRSPAASLGANYLEICDRAVGPDSAESRAAALTIRSVLSGGNPSATLEYPCHSPTEQRWFLMSVSAVDIGTPRGAVVMHLDISRRHEAEMSLAALSRGTEQRERILSTIFSSMSDYAYIFDRRGRFLFANQPLLDLWGLSLAQVVGRDCLELGYPEPLALRIQAQIARVYAEGVNITDETAFTTRDGQTGRYEYIFSPVLAPDGSVESVVGNTRDITERTRAAAALQASMSEERAATRELSMERSRLLVAQQVAKIGSWEIDLATMDVVWSEETHRIFETETAARHDRFLALVHPDDRTRVDHELKQSLGSREPQDSEYRLLLEGHRIKHLEARWRVVFDSGGVAQCVVGTTQDISERKQAEIRIQRLNRGYIVLSQINALIVRTKNRDDLFQESCEIAVRAGLFPLAWIGRVDVAAQRVVPTASAGADDAFLAQLGERLSLAGDPGATATAVREKRWVVINDLTSDAGYENAQAYLDRGIRSLASLPLIVGGEVVAVLALHSGDVGYFDQAEMGLLLELAEDIAFAIDYIGKSEQLTYVAYYDALTGLANRSLFFERARQCLTDAGAAGRAVAMVLVDLERFKGFNDSLGQAAGDELLRQVGAWLAANLADPTLLARVGADVFAFLLVDAPSPGDSGHQLDKLIQALLDQPFAIQSGVFRIAGKFGVALYPGDAPDPESLFMRSESALKSAKSGGLRQLFYTQELTEADARRLALENQLRHALDRGEFVLYFQPKVDLHTGQVSSAEALLRWNDPLTGLVPPFQFIPVLEETGLIHDVGRWALRKALDEYLRWRRAGLAAPRVAVNVSVLQLRDSGFVADIAELLALDPLAAEGLELEITESMLMSDIDQSIASLLALRAMGLRVAIDDFGTGFSSLGYLSKLPVDSLKIDCSFVKDMTRSPEGLSLVSTVITLAHSMNLTVVAEGVETQEQRAMLTLLRCDEMQGYLFSKPVPAEEFEARFLRPA